MVLNLVSDLILVVTSSYHKGDSLDLG